MKKSKLWYLLLAPILLSLFFVSCTGSKPNEDGQTQSDNTQKIAAQSPEAIPQPSSPEATPQPSSTNFSPQPSAIQSTPQPTTKTADVNDDITDHSLQGQPSRFTDAAKFLAGMRVDKTSPLTKSLKDQSWQEHAKFFDYAWAKLDNQQLSKVRKWAGTELVSLNLSAPTIFYPFSGPDFLYAYSFFPNGSEYVLVGLEPVGEIPNLDELSASSEIGRNLHWIESSMADVMQLSFFKTKDMAKDFKETRLKGVLPILFVFLARTNNTIQDVNYIDMDKDGTVRVLDRSQKGKPALGVKIDFIPAGEYTTRSLYYFSTDLSDQGLQKSPEFRAFIQNLPIPVTYLKAASYLMHQKGFANIRNLILSQSSSLLQDDSGMPLKYFNRSRWELKFYGNYIQPIDLFKKFYQPDLRKVYESNKTIKPLNFGIGYQFQLNHSNLVLATSK